MDPSKDNGSGKSHQRGASSNRGSSSRPPRQPSPHRSTANRPSDPPRNSTAGSASETRSEALARLSEYDDMSFSYGVMRSTDSSGETASGRDMLRRFINRNRSAIPRNVDPNQTTNFGVSSTTEISGQAVQPSVRRYEEENRLPSHRRQPPLEQSQTSRDAQLQNPIPGETQRDQRQVDREVLQTDRSDSHSSEDSSGS